MRRTRSGSRADMGPHYSRPRAASESRWSSARPMPIMPPMRTPRTPGRFLWGAGTSAHQIEGGNDRNDWWEWEKGGDGSAAACLGWERYEEDLDLLESFGLDAYRFSLEWSRIEPEAGRYDEAA